MPKFPITFSYTGIAQIISLLFALLGAYLVITGVFSVWWLLVWFICHTTLTGIGSVGAHSYACHNSFEINAFWKRFFAVSVPAVAIGDEIQWGVGHTAHHDYSDTDQDPHNIKNNNPWRFWKWLYLGEYVKPKKYSFRFSKHLLKDKFVLFVHDYAGYIPFIVVGILLPISVVLNSPILLYAYLAPLFTVLTAGALHNRLSHGVNGPRDLPWLIWLFPFEWAHGSHHEQPANPNKAFKYRYLPDFGYLVIRLIRSKND
jgi:stearoyl-CoA desaturase (delta-9 desaturase)